MGHHHAHAGEEGRVVFRDLLSVEDARAKWYGALTPAPSGSEEVPLERALGRVASRDVLSTVDVPPFDRAVMDGFAVLASDTFGAEEDRPRKARVVGKIAAGEVPRFEIGPGRAAEIATGSVLPKGANAVGMVEYSRSDGRVVDLYRAVSPGENVFAAGADIMAGETVVRRGTRLTPREVGVLAAIGKNSLDVWRRPRVAIVSTGNELVPPGTRLPPGKIYDINASSLAAAVAEAGGEPILRGIFEDKPEILADALKAAHREADFTVVSGGTSAGAGDLIYRVLDELGPPGILVHGVAVKPGKPTILAVAQGKPILGLPGYPTSALMIFQIFGAPVVGRMAGYSEDERNAPQVRATLSETVHAGGGRREMQPVHLSMDRRGGYCAFPLPAESGAITTLAQADGFFVIAEGTKIVRAGTAVDVGLFGERLRPADLTIIGSHCLGIDLLLELVLRTMPGLRAKVIAVGSTGGIAAIARGQADLAGIHLLDEHTASWNVQALSSRGLEGRAVLVRGYLRSQVIAVRPGNPRRVRSVESLLEGKAAFINRNPGSGTRALVDAKLREVARSRGLSLEEAARMIPGWEIEAKSHTAVATAVATGRADAGVCVEAAAVRAGLERIRVAEEQFDLLVRADRVEAAPVKAVLEALASLEFARELPARNPGFRTTQQTGKIVWSLQEKRRTQKAKKRAARGK